MAVDYGGVIKKLKELKAEKGFTNEALAEKSGVPLGTVNKLFAGSIGSIKIGTLSLLADALDAPLAALLGIGEEKREIPQEDGRGDNFGFVRAGVSSPKIRVADVEFNAAAIISAAERAAKNGLKILVLPELSLTGYTLGDLFYQTALLEAAERGIASVAERTAGLGLLLIFGAPIRREGRIYNCAAVTCNGEILGFVPKTYLPNYNEFYDKRQFNPAPKQNGEVYVCGRRYPFGTGYIFRNREMPEMRVGVEICEDLWVAEPPSVKLAVNGATVIANLSCSDETIGKAEYRRNLISMQAAKTFTAYLYANAGDGESTTDMVFSGHSIVCDNGKILDETKLFTSADAYADLDLSLIEFERSKFTNYNYPSEGGVEFIDFSLPVRPVEI
ncbi:MAG: helix-turn-helix domain-containing protein, partial [Clostridia bacterium]|nr:helix-turn-helix domain-containing protein [Clostridia bacterium]